MEIDLCAWCTKISVSAKINCGIFLVDKCPQQMYNSFKFKGRYKSMTVRFSAMHSHNARSASAAAACTSARVYGFMDTAMILAVSIIIVLLRLRSWA